MKQSMVFNGILLAAIVISFSNCGSTRPPARGFEDDVPDEIQKLIDMKYKEGLFTVGSAIGPNESIARNKAVMQARAEIARQFKAQVDVLQKDYEESVNNKPLGEYNQVMEIFTSLELDGSEVAKTMIRSEKNDIYTAKVLVVVSAEQIKSLLDAKMASFTSYKALKGYKELEQRVQKEHAQQDQP